MSQHDKQGLRWKIFNVFGPPEVQSLVNYIDELTEDGSDIAIYPHGEYNFSVKTSMDDSLEPLKFETPQERASFQLGLSYGVGLMGGSTSPMSVDEFEAMQMMTKKTTHGGGGHRNN